VDSPASRDLLPPPAGGTFLFAPVAAHDQFTPADFTDEQQTYAETAESFVRNEVLPRLEEIEQHKDGIMPALLKRAGELGLLMIDVPEEYGGLGLSKAVSMLVSERAGKLASFSVSWGAHTGIGTLPLVYYGTEAQKKKYLPRLATGELLAAYALTEPGSGSDALAAKTRADLSSDGKFYVLSGTKQYITNAGFADLFTVFAKVGGEKFSAFLVERGTPGVTLGPEERKLGIRGSSTRQVIFDNARVPVENVLGTIGQGHKIAFNILNVGRFKLGCGAAGAAKECFEVAVRYSTERRQFDRPISSFGMIQRKIADMAVRIYVANACGYRTAGLMDAAAAAIPPGAPDYWARAIAAIEEYTIEDSIIKIFGTESLDMVADESLQILGGAGFIADYPIERHYRDQRIFRIFEGTNEINRLIIPATLMKRIGRGALRFQEFLAQVELELDDVRMRQVRGKGPLGLECLATDMAKRVLGYTVKVVLEKELASLADQQQHLEILANMAIDIYAMDSAVGRTLKLIGKRGEEKTELERQLTHVFVASANGRVTEGARRLLANEATGEELRGHFAAIDAFVPFFPIRTIETKKRIAEAIVARPDAITATL